ncbi:MSHA biogenesis protein MshK [Massilia sp. TWR1-2-2]|uniref:MSHA biogenesis protein MshK n=1 Tax=Massilia sp. TWR1-2-2 TaxID=2804584 RepID=UPI003CEF27A0
MDHAMKRAVWFSVLLHAGAGASAQALQDPTRPPASMIKPQPGAAAVADAPSAPVLQSVLVAREPGGRQVAVIDGEAVRLGGAFRGAVLVRISDGEVELQRGQQRQVLKLFAGPASIPIPRSK